MKKVESTIATLLLLLMIGLLYYLSGIMPIGSGYTAKYLCSQVFIADKQPDTVFQKEIKPTHPMFLLFSFNIDRENKTVTATGFGKWSPKTAVYREGYGCTLAVGKTAQELKNETAAPVQTTLSNPNLEWPLGKQVDDITYSSNANRACLDRTVEDAFRESDGHNPKNTDAVVIVHNGRIVSEKYADHVAPDTPLLGWSMSKSVTNALVGILVKQGKLDIMEKAPVQAWQDPNDPRHDITIDQLLRMSSGLEFEENYAPFTDVTTMLYDQESMADYAASKPLAAEPDTVFNYSSGTANIIADIVKEKTGGTLASHQQFAQQELFQRIMVHSAILEPDASGTFVGSSYMFATARDWARIGLLYLNDGLWYGKRILPEGWVDYSTTPTPQAPQGKYGALIRLNAGEEGSTQNRVFPSLPTDLFYFSGYNEQIVAVIPSEKLIVVRLGVTHDREAWNEESFISDVVSCVNL